MAFDSSPPARPPPSYIGKPHACPPRCRERVAWRRDLLQQRVHLLAGATLTQAVTTLKHETLAGRKARLQKLQARSRGRGGGAGGGSDRCGCGNPGCLYERPGAAGEDGGMEDRGPSEEAAGRGKRIGQATSLVFASLKVLEALREVGGLVGGLQDGLVTSTIR